ncbi:MAG: hypothetical protein HZB33_07530 [Nitrospirae bacterium]|nr:hypothetical protein [Nitrospirota bacterium]
MITAHHYTQNTPRSSSAADSGGLIGRAGNLAGGQIMAAAMEVGTLPLD